MTEPLPDLASAVFHLRLHPDYPVPQQKGWYGKAIRAIFLNGVRWGYSEQTSAEMHTDNQLRAYTVSNLLPDPGSEEGQKTQEFSFCITVCHQEAFLALLNCTLPGNQLAPGSHLNLSGLHCQVVDWCLRDQANYEELVEAAFERKPKPNETIELRFVSPVYFKDTKTAQYTGGVTPLKVIGSLLSKWRTNSSFSPPKCLMTFAQKHVFMNAEGISIVNLKTGSNTHKGSVGVVSFITDKPKDPAWAFLHSLARFSEFVGVGKDTAIGFGQARLHLDQVGSASERANN